MTAGSEAAAVPLPVRMLNEYAYCPRLFHLMHVQGRWADNEYTEDGRQTHKRVDKLDHVLPEAEASASKNAERDEEEDAQGDAPPVVTASVALSSENLGLTAKLDLVSTAADEAAPVERKRGKVPDNPERSWEPERVQLMAQGLLLREHGYRCDHGILYFAASRTRVPVVFTPELEERTLGLLEAARETADGPVPDPLEDSPKCKGCSLASICLPDETCALAALSAGRTPPDIRRLYPARDHALPFYVQSQGATVGKTRASLVVREGRVKVATVRLKDMSQLVLCGNISVSPQALHLLCEAGIPVVHYSTGFWFYGMTTGWGLRNGYARAAQYRCAEEEERRLLAAKEFVRAKGQNQRTLLRRNAMPKPEDDLSAMKDQLARLDKAGSRAELLGFEGGLAAAYFRSFSAMFKQTLFGPEWDFNGRNRRPPRDPVNAMLSFCYALLVKDCTVALWAEGLDPYWGLFHEPRHGRPALALDLMEEFRPLVADSAVLSALNTMMVNPKDFRTSASGCLMSEKGRKAVIRAYEARMDQMVTHPVFDYRCSWRSILRVQARLLARWLRGETVRYKGFTTR